MEIENVCSGVKNININAKKKLDNIEEEWDKVCKPKVLKREVRDVCPEGYVPGTSYSGNPVFIKTIPYARREREEWEEKFLKGRSPFVKPFY